MSEQKSKLHVVWKIQNLVHSFEWKYRVPPDAIYISKDVELEILKYVARYSMSLTLQDVKEKREQIIAGIPYFIVEGENHFALGIRGDE